MKAGDKFGWVVDFPNGKVKYYEYTVISRGINKVGADAVLFGNDKGEPRGTAIYEDLINHKYYHSAK